jgi:hypothetical protein
MRKGEFVESTNMPAKQAITAPTYGQWMTTQPGYSDWVKAYQKPGAPAAAGFAAGGPVRKAIPAGQMVASKDYGQLDPGSAPINEGTAAQWRIDAAAQKRAQERLQKRDQEYHNPTPVKAKPSKVATPPRRQKKGDVDETGAVPPEAATEAYPGSRAPATPPPGTPGAGKPGELGTPNDPPRQGNPDWAPSAARHGSAWPPAPSRNAPYAEADRAATTGNRRIRRFAHPACQSAAWTRRGSSPARLRRPRPRQDQRRRRRLTPAPGHRLRPRSTRATSRWTTRHASTTRRTRP